MRLTMLNRSVATPAYRARVPTGGRAISIALFAAVVVGCTPLIPAKDDFGTSALVPSPGVPPEFAGFNNYNTGVNGLLADQICATAYAPLEDKAVAASPGALEAARGQCAPHIPSLLP